MTYPSTILLTTLAAISLSADASLNPYHSNPADFSYSQVLDVDLSSSDEMEDEDDVDAEYSSMTTPDSPSVQVVQSEIMFCGLSGQGGCFVESETSFVEEPPEEALEGSLNAAEYPWLQWGDDVEDPFNMSTFRHPEDDDAYFYRSKNTDDDEDEDDEDDEGGHSSMLSNASLRRNRGEKVEAAEPSSDSSSSATLAKLRGGATAPLLSNIFESELSKRLFVTALVTLVFEGCIGHILEFLKICMQTSQKETSYLAVIRGITAEKGIAGLWDGFLPWGVVQAVAKGAVFGVAHAAATKYLKPFADDGTIPLALALTMAGGIGGGFQGYVLSPTLLLKTRVMTNPAFREQMSLLRTTLLSFRIGWDVVATEGVTTLMKGANVFALKRVFDWSTRYFFADLFELFFQSCLQQNELSVAHQSVASLLGGVASTCATLPLDVLVAKTQDAKKAGVKVSALQLFLDELNEKGLAGLQQAYLRGFTARLLHVCLTTAVVKNGTPLVRDWIFKT